jgi:DNA-binding GntR family transcriptional regulator
MARLSLLPGQPRYRQVAARLYGQIHDGTYPPGGALPTEQQLADEYGLSRNMIRQALALLRQQGIVDVVQGSGHYVRPRPEPQPAPLPTRDAIEAGSAEPMREVGYAPLPASLAKVFNDEPGSPSYFRRRRTLHTSGGLPLRRDSVYLWPGEMKVTELDRLSRPDPIPRLPDLVERMAGRPEHHTTTTITARLPDPQEAAEFRIADTTPLLVVVLAGWDANRFALWAVESIWPAERVELVTELPRRAKRRPSQR